MQECAEPITYLSEAPVLSEASVMSAYGLDGGTVYLTYSTTATGWNS